MAILAMAIGACGHIGVRTLGARYGLPVAGLASGFVSSIATTAVMGSKAKDEPSLLRAAVAGAVLSNVATIVQMALLTEAISPATLTALRLPLLLAGLAAIGYGLVFTLWAVGSGNGSAGSSGEAFSISAALVLVAIIAASLVLVAAARTWFGGGGLAAAAALAGFGDAHSAAVSVTSLVSSGKIGVREAIIPILLGFTTNSLTKIVFAITSGGGAFAWRVVPGILVVLAALWGGFLLT